MLNLIKKYKFLITLLIIELILFAANYKWGTYLVGWDNVYPELNFSENIRRGLFSIWQEYRGLGVIDGMAHAALLPHTLTVFFLSWILPHSFLRYFMNFSLHFAGEVGVYLLIKQLLKTEKKEWLSFIGALFYGFNLITIQMFFTPLEVFSYHFAFLPLLTYSLLNFLNGGRKKQLGVFLVLSVFSIPQAHVPSVFLVYFGTIIVLILGSFFTSHSKKINLKRSIVGLLAVFCVNAYWGFPYIYSTIYGSKAIVESKINQMSTENIVLRNKEFGNFTSVALLRGFPLKYVDYQPNGRNDFMMKEWRQHIFKLPVYLISLFFFIITVIGIGVSFKEKRKEYYPFLLLFTLSFLMLGNDIPLLSFFSKALQTFIPLFYNVFRFVFTKFSLLYVFTYSLFLVIGLKWLVHKISLRRIKNDSRYIFAVVLFSLFIYTFPSFQGHFFYNNLRLSIPQDYFELIEFFKTQDTVTRIATLPQSSFWGWPYYEWGARGSGFIWYGMTQPMLEGAFYPWSRQNENYYWELSQAIYSQDLSKLRSIFEKYDIKWLVFDHNIVSPFSPKATFLTKTEEMINGSNFFVKEQQFGNIDIYRVNLTNSSNAFISLKENLPTVMPVFAWNNNDQAFLDFGNYQGEDFFDTDFNYYYPFRSLFTGRNQDDLGSRLVETENTISFLADLPADTKEKVLSVPFPQYQEIVEVDKNDLSIEKLKYPLLYLNDELINASLSAEEKKDENSLQIPLVKDGVFEVRIPKNHGYNSYKSREDENFFRKPPRNCAEIGEGTYKQDIRSESGTSFLHFESVDASSCLDIDLPYLPHTLGYLVAVETRNLQGKELLFSVINKNSQRADLEIYLFDGKTGSGEKFFKKSYFIISPMENYGLGYTLQFRNESIGQNNVTNDLKGVEVYPIPYRFLSQIKIINPSVGVSNSSGISSRLISVSHPNPSWYEVVLTTNNLQQTTNNHLILSQAFDTGWKAYEIECQISNIKCQISKILPFAFGKELTDHVMVNNWANGWEISGQQLAASSKENTKIIILFWPQLLEFFGFLLLPMPVLFLLKKKLF